MLEVGGIINNNKQRDTGCEYKCAKRDCDRDTIEMCDK